MVISKTVTEKCARSPPLECRDENRDLPRSRSESDFFYHLFIFDRGPRTTANLSATGCTRHMEHGEGPRTQPISRPRGALDTWDMEHGEGPRTAANLSATGGALDTWNMERGKLVQSGARMRRSQSPGRAGASTVCVISCGLRCRQAITFLKSSQRRPRCCPWAQGW